MYPQKYISIKYTYSLLKWVYIAKFGVCGRVKIILHVGLFEVVAHVHVSLQWME